MSFNISSFHIKAHTLLPIQVCLPFSGGLTTFSRSPPRVPSPFHSTQQCSCYPAISYTLPSFSPSPHWVLSQGREAMPHRDSKESEFFWGRIHSHSLYMPGRATVHKNRKISLNSSSRFFLLPDQLPPRAYEIRVPCCTCTSIRDTISFCILPPFSRLSCSTSSPLFHPPNKIFAFSALVFKRNNFMIDGLPTVRFPQLSLKYCQSLSSSNDRWLGAAKSRVLALIIIIGSRLRTALADRALKHY